MSLSHDTLKALHEAATPGPWAYRPDEYDDWGVVKSPREPVEGFPDGLRCVLAQFRDPKALDEDVLSEHRRAKTDPWRGNAKLVVFLRNAVPEILTLIAERDAMRGALEDIRDPMRKLRREAEAEGARLSGYAYAIANDKAFIQSIARDTLAALGGNQHGS